MKRRTYLSGLAAGLAGVAGCMATGSDSSVPAARELVAVSAAVPDDSDVSVEPTVERRTIDSERTAQFELAVTWNGTESQGLSFGNRVPFSFPNYSTGRSGLVLLPANTSIERRNDRKWVPETYDDGNIASNSTLVVGELEPGESVSETWAVWADPQNASRIEPGTYRFDDRIGLYSDLSSDDGDQIEWSLTVEIAES